MDKVTLRVNHDHAIAASLWKPESEEPVFIVAKANIEDIKMLMFATGTVFGTLSAPREVWGKAIEDEDWEAPLLAAVPEEGSPHPQRGTLEILEDNSSRVRVEYKTHSGVTVEIEKDFTVLHNNNPHAWMLQVEFPRKSAHAALQLAAALEHFIYRPADYVELWDTVAQIARNGMAKAIETCGFDVRLT